VLTEKEFFALVGARIRAIRIAKGISQGEVARRIRSYQQNVARTEAGTNATLDILFRIAQALGVEPVEFFRFEAGGQKPLDVPLPDVHVQKPTPDSKTRRARKKSSAGSKVRSNRRS
jgi:transcriptional regulator with XRE-family HTH domain